MSETRTPTMSEWVDKHRETLGRLLCGNPDASFAAIIEAAKECAGLCARCGLNPRQVCVGCAMFAERSEPAAASVPQGGEFTAAEVEAQAAAEHYYRWATTGNTLGVQRTIDMLRAHARSLSSAPGERTKETT
jgi:hypothetical protein